MQIKWNEVTWYSKLAAIVFFLGVFPSLAFYFGLRYEKVKNDYVVVLPAVTTPLNKSSFVASTSIPVLQVDTSDWKTYKNDKYGFEIKYPPDWIEGDVSENIDSLDLSFSDSQLEKKEKIGWTEQICLLVLIYL